jgi:predicted RNA binding protein YcfA (HicA-like mRNA interferase family)
VKAISGKRLCRLLEIRGWDTSASMVAIIIYAKSDSNLRILRICVPIHDDSALKIGLQKQIIKMADIDETEL